MTPRQIVLEVECDLAPAAGVVFSTAPRAATDDNGTKYVFKGQDDPRIVLAELVGYGLARILHIPVPECAVGRFPGDSRPAFCSQMLEVRDMLTFWNAGKVSNPEAIASTIALDVWIANGDRNAGNFVGSRHTDRPGWVEAFAIDFEKSQVVRLDQPLVGVPMIDSRTLWPTGDLGAALRERLTLPLATLDAIRSMADGDLRDVIVSSMSVVGSDCGPDLDSLLMALNSRKRAIRELVGEAWQ